MALEVKTAKMSAIVDGVWQEVTILVVGDARPVGEGITINYSEKLATITGLAGTRVSFSGKTATIGG